MNSENHNKLPKLFFDSDADLSLILSKKVAIIGYGNQGRAQALNLRDSGVDVVVGLRKSSVAHRIVEKDMVPSNSISEVVKDCDIISVLVPDQVTAEVFEKYISGNLVANKTLNFAHGYSVHYQQIKIPKDINVIMVAPSGPGTQVRETFQKGSGVPNLIAIHQDFTGNSKKIALSYSKAIGGTKAGAFFSTFKEEVETDLFSEQVVLTGGIPKIIQSAFKVLVEAGYQPITAWFVCYYELKTIVDLFHKRGFELMNKAISDTAEYGGNTRGPRLINSNVENEMRTILSEIQSDKFFREWSLETEKGLPNLKKMRKKEKDKLIDRIGRYVWNQIEDNNEK